MVENGVREEIRSLNELISAEKTRSRVLEEMRRSSEDGIEFFTPAVVYYEKELERKKGTVEESEAREGVKNTKSWLEEYVGLLERDTRNAQEQKERLEALKLRLKELKG
jgi:hypothetical protein